MGGISQGGCEAVRGGIREKAGGMPRARKCVRGEDEGRVWGLLGRRGGCAEGGGGEGNVIFVVGKVGRGMETEAVRREDGIAEGVVELLAEGVVASDEIGARLVEGGNGGQGGEGSGIAGISEAAGALKERGGFGWRGGESEEGAGGGKEGELGR